MTYGRGKVAVHKRSCLVCHEPATTEAQLCDTCVANGARVENNTLFITLVARLAWTRRTPRPSSQ